MVASGVDVGELDEPVVEAMPEAETTPEAEATPEAESNTETANA